MAAADRVLRHEFDLLGSGPFVPVDPDAAGDGRLSADRLVPRSRRGLRFPRGVPLQRVEPLRDAARPGRHQAAVGARAAASTGCRSARRTGSPGTSAIAAEIVRPARRLHGGEPGRRRRQLDLHDGRRAARGQLGARPRARPRQPALDATSVWRAPTKRCSTTASSSANLENKYEVTSNHFLSNVVGLYYLGVVFRRPAGRRALARQCRDWLEQEIDVQVLPDGADYESSVPYHRLVAELFLGRRAAGRARRHAAVGRTTSRGCARWSSFSRACCGRTACMPQVGDADDGRLHIFTATDWQPQDARHLLAPAAAAVRRAAVAGVAGDDGRVGGGVVGLRRRRRPSRRDAARDHASRSCFRDAGLAVVRQDARTTCWSPTAASAPTDSATTSTTICWLRIPRRRRAADRRSRQLRLHVRPGRAESVSQHGVPQHADGSTASSRTRSGRSGCSACSRPRRPSTSAFEDTPTYVGVPRPPQRLRASAGAGRCTSGRSDSLKNAAALVDRRPAARIGRTRWRGTSTSRQASTSKPRRRGDGCW